MPAKTCHTCRGQGVLNIGGRAQTCPICEGAGQVQLTPARVPRWYSTQIVVPLNGSNSGSIQILTDADFEWVFTMSTQTSNLLAITAVDQSTGRILTPTNNLNAGAFNITLFAGTAQLPFPLLEPYILARSATITFTLTDSSGAQNTCTIVLQGFSLFPQEAQQQGSAGIIQQPAGNIAA
jgi:hypothetical protein